MSESQPKIQFQKVLNMQEPYNWSKYYDASETAFNFMKDSSVEVNLEKFNFWTVCVLFYASERKHLNIGVMFKGDEFKEWYGKLDPKHKGKLRKLDSLELCKNYVTVPVRA